MADNPFDLVNQFSAMQAEMRPPGKGLGPNGPQANTAPGHLSSLRQQRVRPMQKMQQQMPQGGSNGLVSWGGKQIHSSVLPYAQQMQQRFPGLRFSSGYRDPVHNQRVNGVPNSFHLKGRALDFSGSAKDMQAARAWARENGAREALIHNAGSGTHLHIAW